MLAQQLLHSVLRQVVVPVQLEENVLSNPVDKIIKNLSTRL